MRINKYRWNLLVFPEDDAYRQLANGLRSAFPDCDRLIQIMPIAGGWHEAVAAVENDSNLSRYPERRVLLLIDSDKDTKRLDAVRAKDFFRKYAERIFIISSAIQAEDLQKFAKQSNPEKAGMLLGDDCSLWKNELLSPCLNDACRLHQELTQNRANFKSFGS